MSAMAGEPRQGLAGLVGARVGYARVSTCGQLLDRQLLTLTSAGCVRIFADKKSGRNTEREKLWKALDYLRPGDTLVVPSLDRLGRSLQDLIAIVSGLRKREIGLCSLHRGSHQARAGFAVQGAFSKAAKDAGVEWELPVSAFATDQSRPSIGFRDQENARPPGCPPDPTSYATTPAFIDGLRQLRLWAGDLSYRELAQRAADLGSLLSKSSAQRMLAPNGDRLPNEDHLAAFVLACGATKQECQTWLAVHHRLGETRMAGAAEDAVPAQDDQVTG